MSFSGGGGGGGGVSHTKSQNFEKFEVKIHNCAFLLDFLALFGYNMCISLFSRISTSNALLGFQFENFLKTNNTRSICS